MRQRLLTPRITKWLLLLQQLALVSCLSGCLLSCSQEKHVPGKAKARTVEIRKQQGKFQLYRNGAPYFIRGAGGYEHFHKLKKAGGNSIRIWTTDNAEAVLDSAHRLGLTVTLGLKVANTGTEMDYGNTEAVAAQREQIKQQVLRYKDHPALLMWAIGNEPTLYVNPSIVRPFSLIQHTRTWLAIDEIAAMIHDLDANHPTTTMLQAVPGLTSLFINYFCDHLDVISVNLFIPLEEQTLIDREIRKIGFKKPYVISEYGNSGYWDEKRRTDWGAITEQSSTRKGRALQKFYQRYMHPENGNCLGSYVFYWGQKHEYTATWFSLFTENGEATEMTDVLQYLWTGSWPVHMAPSIYSLRVKNNKSNRNRYLQANKRYQVEVEAKGNAPDSLALYWELVQDDTELVELFYHPQHNQAKPAVKQSGRMLVAAARQQKSLYAFPFTAPGQEGPYRLFVYLRNQYGKVATANTTLYLLP